MNHFSAIQKELKCRNLDAMLLTDEANRYYASGFYSSGTDGIALVTREKNYYFTDFRYIEAAQREVTDAEVVMTSAQRGYAALINEVIERHGIKTLAYEDAYMTVAVKTVYEQKLKAELSPASNLLAQLRAVKDDEEIALLVSAQRIAEKAFAEILNELRPGVSEREIAARLIYWMLHFGAENVSFDPIVVSGANGSMPHGVPGDKLLAEGEFVTMDFGCKFCGYCSDMTRTVALGHVTDEMARVYGVVLEAQATGIAAARSGITGREADGAARSIIEANGYGEYFGHSFGHGVGVEIHEAPNLSPLNEKLLPAGAVVSAEPGIYLPGRFGVRIEDVLVLREGGCEDITKAPKELLIL